MKTKLNMCFLAAMVVALVWALPAYAGKATLSEAELDEVTAAGQPKIVISEVNTDVGTNSVSFIEALSVDLNLGNGAQNNLRALTLNNVLGENEVANAMNIVSTSQNANITQANVIQQSWGSVLDFSGIAGSTGGSGGAEIAITGGRCVFGPCVVGANGRNGSNARRLTAMGDVIIHATGGIVDVSVLETNSSELFLGLDSGGGVAPQAQQGLAALVLNNVVGMNQVANGVNILGGDISLATGTIAGSNSLGGGRGVANQSNIADQFRGAPLSGAGSSISAAGVATFGTIQATRN
ncbi:MAG: hypothetical protein HY695_01840 [Deltaproteobacteria bacterium]|nr:hypothetical protein [Deltaproteobacteria bacterium]